MNIFAILLILLIAPRSVFACQNYNLGGGGASITSLTGDVTASGPGSASATVAQVGGYSAANVAAGATLANAATNANTASAIVKRDGSGNFSAGTITAALNGNASTATSCTTASALSGTLGHGSGGTDVTSPGTAGNVLLSDGSNWTSGPPSVGGYPTQNITWFRDFTGSTSSLSDDFIGSNVSGSGSINSINPTGLASHPGIVEHTTGTTSTGRAGFQTDVAAFSIGGTFTIVAWVNIPVLADVTDDYTYHVGLMDSASLAAPNNAAMIQYSRASSVNWQCISTRAASSMTRTGSSAVAANTWYRLKVVATTSAVQCFVDDVQIDTDITTNIPTAALGFFTGIIKSAGTTSRRVALDAIWMNYAMTTAR